MTNFEFGIENDLIRWEVNELFGVVNISIKDVYPKNDADVQKILNFLVSEAEE